MEKSNYLVLVYKVRVWIIMFEIEAFAGLRIRSVLMYSTGSKAKNNENIGHYGQTLAKAKYYFEVLNCFCKFFF